MNAIVESAMTEARFELIDDDATVYGEIQSMRGVYAIGATQSECEAELRSVAEEWIELAIPLRDSDA